MEDERSEDESKCEYEMSGWDWIRPKRNDLVISNSRRVYIFPRKGAQSEVFKRVTFPCEQVYFFRPDSPIYACVTVTSVCSTWGVYDVNTVLYNVKTLKCNSNIKPGYVCSTYFAIWFCNLFIFSLLPQALRLPIQLYNVGYVRLISNDWQCNV